MSKFREVEVEHTGSVLKHCTSTLVEFYENPAGLKVIKNAPEAPQAHSSAEAARRSPVPRQAGQGLSHGQSQQGN